MKLPFASNKPKPPTPSQQAEKEIKDIQQQIKTGKQSSLTKEDHLIMDEIKAEALFETNPILYKVHQSIMQMMPAISNAKAIEDAVKSGKLKLPQGAAREIEDLGTMLASLREQGKVVDGAAYDVYEYKSIKEILKKYQTDIAVLKQKANVRIYIMINNLANDTTLGLSTTKKQTIVGIGNIMLNNKFEPAFVAGMLGNIVIEGSVGFFESSAYPYGEPIYLQYMDQFYNYRQAYSGQYIMSKSLSKVNAMLNQLKAANWQKGQFGLGCVQWTGERTKTLVDLYIQAASPSDSITFDQALEVEGLMIVQEFQGPYSKVHSNWQSTNAGSLNSANAAYNAGLDICNKYEQPGTSTSVTRANTAKDIYNVMIKN